MEQQKITSRIQYRINFLKAVNSYVPIIGIIAAVGYVFIYLVTSAWQMLVAALIAVLGSGLFLFGRRLIVQEKVAGAAALMMIIGVALVPIYTFFWSGVTIEFIILAWCIAVFIAWFGMERSYQFFLTPLVGIIASGLIFVIDRYSPFPRLNITDVVILRLLIPLVVTLGGALLFLIIIRGIVTGRLANRMLPAFLLIVLIPIVTLSTSSIFNAQDNDRRNAVNTLENVVSFRDSEINRWLDDMQGTLSTAYQNQQTIMPMTQLLAATSQADKDNLHWQTITQFYSILSQTDLFQELLLMKNDGTVVADTDQTLEGKNVNNLSFFALGKKAISISTSSTLDQPDGPLSIFISLPVVDPLPSRHGQIVGVMAARADLHRLDQILVPPSGQAAMTLYLVNNNYKMLYTTAGDNGRTRAVEAGISSKLNGSIFYSNQGIPVASVYHWLPKLNAVLLAEMPQSLLFSDLRSIVTTNLIIAVLSAVIAILGAYYTIRTLITPLSRLEKAARQVALGDFNISADVEQQDEFGIVSNAFNEMTTQLRTQFADLGERVKERTRDIELRSIELRTAAQIARDSSMAQSTDELLNHATRLIRERFGFYHVGIFLIDDNGEYAVLRAAGGEAGQLMLANKHKLKVGEVGIVGYVAQTGEPRIALDVGADAVHFRNPLLPYTRSEMSLPLKINQRTIGVLDVQSDKINAFNQDDITIMEILTDQLSVSIERTRLVQELERNAVEMEKSLQEYTSHGWRSLLQQGRKTYGYRFEGVNIEPLTNIPAGLPDASILGSSMIIKGDHRKSGNILAVPIRLRGQTLGTLNLRFQSLDIPQESIKYVEEAAGRLALALENARLVQDAQRLASRERQINVITAQVQQSTDLETILQNTIRELGNTLDVPKTFIQIGLSASTNTDHDES